MSEMTPDEEHAFYARAENQEPQGPARRRLGTPIPVRFSDGVLAEIRRRAEADDRSIASWIRKAVERELHRTA